LQYSYKSESKREIKMKTVRFNYDERLVKLRRELVPDAQWNASDKSWSMSDEDTQTFLEGANKLFGDDKAVYTIVVDGVTQGIGRPSNFLGNYVAKNLDIEPGFSRTDRDPASRNAMQNLVPVFGNFYRIDKKFSSEFHNKLVHKKGSKCHIVTSKALEGKILELIKEAETA
jgi:hypothetical protein